MLHVIFKLIDKLGCIYPIIKRVSQKSFNMTISEDANSNI